MNKIYQKMKEKIKKFKFLYIVLKAIRRAYGFYFFNKIGNYKLEKITFYNHLGYELNLENPQSYNEKIVWKKIHDRNPLLSVTADKYAVRSYINRVLGEEKAKEILIPLLYVTDQPETIAPNSYIPNLVRVVYVFPKISGLYMLLPVKKNMTLTSLMLLSIFYIIMEVLEGLFQVMK